MVFPLMLGLLAAGGLGAAGKSFLERMEAQSAEEAQRERWQTALAAGGGVGPEIGPSAAGPMNILPAGYGQGAPGQQLASATPQPAAGPAGGFDYMAFARSLAEAGDPLGMQMLAKMGGAQQGFEYDTRLQEMRDRAAMERTLAARQATGEAPGTSPPVVRLPGGLEVPFEPTPIGSKGWNELVNEGARLNRVRSVMDEFRTVLMESGTEGRFSGDFRRLDALTNELVGIIGLMEEAGALQEGEEERFRARLPKVASEVPEWLRNEAGVLDALGGWYNNLAQAYNLRSEFTAMTPGVRLFPTSDMVPEGWRPVTSDELEGETPGQQPASVPEALGMTPQELYEISTGLVY